MAPTLPLATPLLASCLLEWYRENARDLPWRRLCDPYRIWVSEVMLQQTQVVKMLPYFERFVDRFPALEALAAADEEDVVALWSGLGYYSRARNLHRAARQIVQHHGGQFPDSLEAALQLPGVGRYTAGAVLSIAYGRPAPVLDGNVRRVLARLLALDLEPGGGLDRQLWTVLEETVRHPEVAAEAGRFNQSLMELGALVCRPREPQCNDCPLESHCLARQANLVAQLPLPRRRRATEELRFTSAVIERSGRYLMRQSIGQGYLEGFWEFPRIPGAAAGLDCAARFRSDLQLNLEIRSILPPIRHHITYRKLYFYPLLAHLEGQHPPDWHWIDPLAPGLAMSSYIGKILNAVQNPTTTIHRRRR